MAGKTSKPAPAEVPAFASDRLRLLGPLVTPRTIELARERILSGESFYSYDKLRDGLTEREVKLALIMVLEMNPRELLDANEQGTLRGTTRARYVKLSEAGELVR